MIFLDPSAVVIPPNYLTVRHRPQTCEAIRITKFIAPIVVKKDGDRYVLVDGYERLMCAKELKIQVPAIVVESENTNILSFALNYVRGKYCGIDVLEAVRQLTAQYDVSMLAKILGRSYDTVRKYRTLAEHLVNVLSADDYKELREQCVSLKKLVQCGFGQTREEIMECITGKAKKVKYVPPELIKKAQELEKDVDTQVAVDLVKTLGADSTVKLVEALDLMRKIVCPQWSKYFGKIDSDVYNTIRAICDVIKV
jgi:ParB-like chromosome segregation protein Spo0J